MTLWHEALGWYKLGLFIFSFRMWRDPQIKRVIPSSPGTVRHQGPPITRGDIVWPVYEDISPVQLCLEREAKKVQPWNQKEGQGGKAAQLHLRRVFSSWFQHTPINWSYKPPPPPGHPQQQHTPSGSGGQHWKSLSPAASLGLCSASATLTKVAKMALAQGCRFLKGFKCWLSTRAPSLMTPHVRETHWQLWKTSPHNFKHTSHFWAAPAVKCSIVTWHRIFACYIFFVVKFKAYPIFCCPVLQRHI